MKKCSTLLAVVALTLLVGPLGAKANIVYNWTGDCQQVTFGSPTGCSHATLHVITTDAYVPGTLFFWSSAETTHPTLLDFRYSDDNISVDFAPIWATDTGQQFQFPAGHDQNGFQLNAAQSFRSNGGAWAISGEGLDPACDQPRNPFCGYSAIGINGVWTRVPEPSTFVLLFVGLAGLLLARRSKLGNQAR